MKALYIITGASKGIGNALANQLEKEGHAVLRMARTNPNQLSNLVSVDLTDSDASINAMNVWIKANRADVAQITLINNAGSAEPMGVVGKIDAAQITQALLLNISAVIALTNAFVATLEDFAGKKFVMNISSGAGRNAYEGWGVYCATKAAVDRFTEVLMVEQKEKAYPVIATSIAPGVIDTDMQQAIRGTSEELFPNIERFIELKKEGKLSTPEETAEGLIAYLRSAKMGVEAITDIRD